jgi:hypothetical protein
VFGREEVEVGLAHQIFRIFNAKSVLHSLIHTGEMAIPIFEVDLVG